jgi:hypothetical protein
MIRIAIITLLTFTTSFQALADAWDDLTMPQAKAVTKFLKKNPWIIDYCDCCDPGDTYLLLVASSEIVPCSWAPEKFSVKVKVTRIAKLDVTDSGINEYNASPLNNLTDYVVYMNYTFAYDKTNKWAVPLFKLVPYDADRNHICKGATKYPQPVNTDGKELSKEYTKWYSKRIAKVSKK